MRRYAAAIASVMAIFALSGFAVASSTQADSASGGQSAPATKKAAKSKTHHKKKRHRSWKLPAAKMYNLNSTAYCDGGTMANGRTVHNGAVAVPRWWPLGRWYQIRSGPKRGKIVQAEDHIGSGSDFDIWMPGGCNQYGRRSIKVALVHQRTAKRTLARQHRSHNHK